MSGALVTAGPVLGGSRVILRLLAVGREVRSMVVSSTRAAEVPTTVNTVDLQRARVSFIAADRDHDVGRVDVVAGCEFLDDRIRRVE